MAVERHIHDDRYFTKGDLFFGQVDAVVGAVRTTVGQQKRWVIRSGYALVLPHLTIGSGADLVIEDGGEVKLV
jgi:hypothetical protein